jgi:hypothetical protein
MNGRRNVIASSTAFSSWSSFGQKKRLTDGCAHHPLSSYYFDLLPGEAMVVALKVSADLSQLKRALKITSLTDAFFDERPTYRGHAGIHASSTAPTREPEK